ncbi:Penicillin-binding protein activator LpoB [Gammaproteobacteria bacterium]
MIAMKPMARVPVLLAAIVSLSACKTMDSGDASDRANQAADRAMYQPIEYANVHQKGPELIVLPGEIKSNNATFSQKFGTNNIADYAELELGKANFRVLERNSLGPMLNEIRMAVNMGDPSALKKFKRGKFKSTKWFVTFDILKAEPVASASTSFDGAAIGGLLGNDKQSRKAASALGTVKTHEAAGVWIVGLRYKLVDANTTEQVATNYFEQKMEIGSQGVSVLGVTQTQAGGVTLDSLVQRLVQQAVADLDRKK